MAGRQSTSWTLNVLVRVRLVKIGGKFAPNASSTHELLVIVSFDGRLGKTTIPKNW